MSRFLPENHPQKGVCDLCPTFGRIVGKRLIVADFTVNAMVHVAPSHQVYFTMKQRLCQSCYRELTKAGKPQVNLGFHSLAKRLTRKQTEVAARKLARNLKKMQDES